MVSNSSWILLRGQRCITALAGSKPVQSLTQSAHLLFFRFSLKMVNSVSPNCASRPWSSWIPLRYSNRAWDEYCTWRGKQRAAWKLGRRGKRWWSIGSLCWSYSSDFIKKITLLLHTQQKEPKAQTPSWCFYLHTRTTVLQCELMLPPLTYCGRRHAPYGHGEAQQGVVLVLWQAQ